eukprot:TRINITY_DN6374_c0_g3_i1.p1 TRINITY_DN6374_c0_g3~~TRINITY_DN6374_c0_g3_i1.p1  ORF type:complete len:137 (-),score=25.28 TRINITY_DN6374_c0_g3_i1:91-501(-)
MSVKVRDLDYVNRRQKLPSCALPPEVRSRLGLARPAACDSFEDDSAPTSGLTTSSSFSGIRERLAKGGQSQQLYNGAAMVASVAGCGASGAGTDWVNTRGHAFVRRGTADQRLAGLQERAKQKRQMTSIGRSKTLL